MKRRRVVLVGGILGLVAGLACSDNNGPTAGVLTLSLQSPNSGQDGAISFVVIGPAVPTGLTAAAGLRVFTDSLGTTTHVVVTGTLSTGPIATLSVPDVNQVAQYNVVVQQAAATNYQLRALVGYALAVAK